jgi:transcriptional regulator of acetoin/glycerol metabolism
LLSEGKPAPGMTIIEELKRDIISQALVMSRSNIRGAAFLLGVKYTTLYAQVKKYERQFLAARLKAREYVPAGDVTLRS